MCTYKHPNVYKCTWHILILVDKLRFQKKSNKKPDLLPKSVLKFTIRTMKMLGGEHSAPHPPASRRVGNLNCCLVHKSANDSQHLYPVWRSREAALSSTGKKPNVQATSWGRGYSENFISIIYSCFNYLFKFTFCKLMQMHWKASATLASSRTDTNLRCSSMLTQTNRLLFSLTLHEKLWHIKYLTLINFKHHRLIVTIDCI